MCTISKNHIFLSFVGLVWFGIQQGFADPNDNIIVQLGEEAVKANCLAESVYWPELDYKNVASKILEPNSSRKYEFATLIKRAVDPNYLPEQLDSEIHFLKGWRGETNENFVLQYEKDPYLIRIKNQTTSIVANRKWISHWIAIVIQRKDKSNFVNKSDPNSIFNFIDQLLSEKVNSKAQNYSGMKNVDGTNIIKPIFMQLNEGYYLVYPVQASHPDIDSVIVWTDGHTFIINLQERQKMVIQR